MSAPNFQKWLEHELQLEHELNSLENKAGIREQLESYHLPHERREWYFGVQDESLRKELIGKFIEYHQFKNNRLPALIADKKNKLNALRSKGLPWVFPSFLACITIWIGYSIWTTPGALAGALVGLFMGQAQVHSQTKEVVITEQTLSDLEKEHQEYIQESPKFWSTNYFSEAEAKSGCKD